MRIGWICENGSNLLKFAGFVVNNSNWTFWSPDSFCDPQIKSFKACICETKSIQIHGFAIWIHGYTIPDMIPSTLVFHHVRYTYNPIWLRIVGASKMPFQKFVHIGRVAVIQEERSRPSLISSTKTEFWSMDPAWTIRSIASETATWHHSSQSSLSPPGPDLFARHGRLTRSRRSGSSPLGFNNSSSWL